MIDRDQIVTYINERLRAEGFLQPDEPDRTTDEQIDAAFRIYTVHSIGNRGMVIGLDNDTLRNHRHKLSDDKRHAAHDRIDDATDRLHEMARHLRAWIRVRNATPQTD